ncbi:MAG: aminotransferase class III-fold pyridoxal phosphate-dependent enzyme [Chloroflexia bacterium]
MLLILDEVQTAFRTGKLFAFEHSGAVPDVLCLSKGIANGVPMGVTVVVEDVSSRIPAGTHGNTFGANPLACAAALAVLDEIEASDLLSHSAETGRTLVSKLEGMDRERSPGARTGTDDRGRATGAAHEVPARATGRGFLALPASGRISAFCHR